MTFRQCAAAYLEAHGDSWRSDKHRRQWAASVERANDAFGGLAVGDIDVDIVVKFLTPIWRATAETGARIRGRIEKVLDWAAARKFRTGENPARWRGHLEHLLGAKPEIEHHAAMPYGELPEFMAALRERSGPIARALELTVLTVARTSEALCAKWDEIDIPNRLWTVPAERMKSGREHVVPLSDRAVSILEELPRTSSLLFPGVDGTKPVHNAALLAVLKELHGNGFVVHGFRSTFSDWAHDATTLPEQVIEACLAHKLKDKTKAAYRRGDALEKRRRLLTEWARYCGSPAAVAADKVVVLAR
jgi:integrase